jgi:hypothetical protein
LQVKQQFLELLQEERLEIVTGGWVMPDEANSIYTSILEQLITGKYQYSFSDPMRIRIQGFDDQKLEKITAENINNQHFKT